MNISAKSSSSSVSGSDQKSSFLTSETHETHETYLRPPLGSYQQQLGYLSDSHQNHPNPLKGPSYQGRPIPPPGSHNPHSTFPPEFHQVPPTSPQGPYETPSISSPEPRRAHTNPSQPIYPAFKNRPRKAPLHRLNARFPWLKIAIVGVIVVAAYVDLHNLTVPQTSPTVATATIAPMQHHLRITERDLRGRKLVALTFDDGPSATTTPRLLDILQEKQVYATFFMLGNRAQSNPDLVRRVESEGHEIGSHTMYHQNLTRISTDAAKSDLSEATTVFQSILGHNPAYLRPPYGNHNTTIDAAANAPIILWSVDTLDWKNRDTDSIVSIARSQVHEGAIILMHDVHATSVDAVPTLIDALRSDGYEFVTISELANAHHKSLTPSVAYYNLKP